MSYEAYKRNDIIREKTRDKKINNQELMFGFTHKDSFLPKEINQKNRLTGNHSMPKNKNIIHSNSTNQIRQQNKISNNKNNYNIININVNNLIINNNNKEDFKKNINNDNMNKVFSKIGSDIINKNIISNEQNKKKNSVAKSTRMNNQKNSASLNRKSKYESLSNIQGVIDNLMEITKCPPPAFNDDSNSPQIEKKNNNNLVNNNNNISTANLNNNNIKL